MITLSRRLLLQLGGSALGVSMLDGWVFRQSVFTRSGLGRLYCATPASADIVDPARPGYTRDHNLFYVYDMDRQDFREFLIPMGLSHQTLIHPRDANQVVVIERDGPFAILLNIGRGEVISKVTASPKHYFSGYGLLNQDGSRLYLAEYKQEIARGGGSILVFRTEDMRLEKRIPIGGARPNNLVWLAESKLGVTHFGVHADDAVALTAVHAETGRTISRLRYQESEIELYHAQVASNGAVFFITHRSVDRPGEEFEKIRESKRQYERVVQERPDYFDFEAQPSPMICAHDGGVQVQSTEEGFRWGLSLAINDAYNVVGATYGLGSTVAFADARSGQAIKTIRLDGQNPRALAVTNDRRYFVATTDQGELHYFDARSLEFSHRENPCVGRYNFVVHAQCAPPIG